MRVYHGSNHNFKKLRISKSLCNYESTLQNEGLGIYFTTDLEVAKSYGKYIYILEINPAHFIDFRKEYACKVYLNKMVIELCNLIHKDIRYMLNMQSIVLYMHAGGIALYQTGVEVYMNLDSCEDFYTRLTDKERQKIRQFLYSYDKSHLGAYMFTYSIKNTGVCKTVDESVVRIVDKKERHLI